jgi:hypothetical protein
MADKFNPLEFTFRRVRGPAGATQREILQAALYKIEHGEDKPGWEIGELGWRNPETQQGRSKNWQYADVQEALGASSKGFGDLLRAYLEGEIESRQAPPRRRRTRKSAAQFKDKRYARRKEHKRRKK